MLTQEQAQGLNIQQHELEDAELQQAKAQKEVDRYYEAIQKAVATVDSCVEQVVTAAQKNGYEVLIIADHGNCDMMWDEEHKPVTSHTTNPVPCIITKEGIELREGGNLGDITPTMLELLGVEQPADMTGKSLIKK